MNLGWLAEWWAQIRRKPAGDPWNDDPQIMAERNRQHRLGITDAYTAAQARAQMVARASAETQARMRAQRLAEGQQ
jgi:hypothetical protein